MVTCLSCGTAAPVTGWLCEECAAGIHGVAHLLPVHIESNVDLPAAALIDRWGRVHDLAVRTIIGRDAVARSIAVMEASVSRRHAEIIRKRDGSWWIVDLVSSNGTVIDDERVDAPRQLHSRNAIFIGDIGFYFVTPSPGEPPIPPRFGGTHRPHKSAASLAASDLQRLYDDDPIDDDGAHTFSGLRSVDLKLVSPSGGNGGVIDVHGRAAQLSEVQYELIRLLVERMTADEGQDERVRGFVRSSELLVSLPWDTPRPEDNHIKQLVRRVRRALVRAEIGDLIESRQGFGYRLRVKLTRPLSLGGS